MRKVGAVVLLVVSLPAYAEELVSYPRTVKRDGLICVQRLNEQDQVIETCRREGEAWSPNNLPKEVVPEPPRPESTEQDFRREPPPSKRRTASPAAEGRSDARIAASQSNGWVAGGVAGGCLLGLLGCGIVTVAAGNSSAIGPREDDYDGSDREAYRLAYEDEIQSKRSEDAILGGLVGTVIVVAGILVVVASKN